MILWISPRFYYRFLEVYVNIGFTIERALTPEPPFLRRRVIDVEHGRTGRYSHMAANVGCHVSIPRQRSTEVFPMFSTSSQARVQRRVTIFLIKNKLQPVVLEIWVTEIVGHIIKIFQCTLHKHQWYEGRTFSSVWAEK